MDNELEVLRIMTFLMMHGKDWLAAALVLLIAAVFETLT